MATFHRALDLAALPADALHPVTVAGREVLLVRRGDAVRAVANRCSHEDARLDGGFLDGDAVECPRHGACFDLATGRALTLPATRPLETYPVRLEAGAVWIGVPDAGESETRS